MNAQKDELDRWLDEALAEYKAPEPRLGLELRTLAYVRSAQSARRFVVWRRWALAAAAVIALAAVAVGLHTYWRSSARQRVADKPQAVEWHVSAIPPSVTAHARTPIVRPGRRQTPPARPATFAAAAEPRLGVFPSPLPLTAEERMLLAVMRRSGGTLTQSAQLQEFIAPVAVEEIKIKPLEDKGANSIGEKK